MKKFKALIATSLACLLDVGVVYGEGCVGSGYRACFKYDTKEVDLAKIADGGESFKKSKAHTSIFGSLGNQDGQYVPKNGKNFLGIVNEQSTLTLDTIRFNDKTIVSNNSWEFGLYVDVGNGGSLKGYSRYGLTVSGLYVANSNQKEDKKNKKSVTFEFRENGVLNYRDLIRIKKNTTRDWYSNVVKNLEIPLAWLGGVWNDSWSEVEMKFDGGARMVGDVYAQGGGSKNTLIFDGKDSFSNFFTKTLLGNRTSLGSVFEGGIWSDNGGENIFDVKEGSVIAESIMGDSYGIKAENGGKNSLTFGGGNSSSKAQLLYAKNILTTSLGNSNT